MYIDLELAKKHLNVESEFTDDDSYIEMLIEVSEESIAKNLCVTREGLATIDGGTEIPAPLKQAILLTIGGYYANREEMTAVQMRPLEQGVKHLISLYRKYQ